MKISDNGIQFIKDREGVKLRAYQDSAGVWTIGYGHTKGVYKGLVINELEATSYLENDLQDAETEVKKLVNVDLNQNQFDALVSFEFNVGKLGKSTLLRLLNAGQYLSAAQQFLKWNKAHVNGKLVALKGLTTRRTLEMNLFLR